MEKGDGQEMNKGVKTEFRRDMDKERGLKCQAQEFGGGGWKALEKLLAEEK